VKAVAALVLLTLGLTAGGASARPPAATAGRPLGFLHVSDGPLPRVVDGAGRTVLLRGVNVDGLVDYWRSDLRPPYPSDPAAYAHGRCPADDPTVEGVPICSFDLPQMRALGYDVIRLNLSWSLLEPTPGRISRTYLDRIAQVVGWAKAQGIWVVLDLHQDAWSKHVFTTPGTPCPPGTETRGYDGAPAWASTHLVPACAVNGTRELDPAVAEAAQRFWLDLPAPDGVGLQEHYAAVAAALARRFGAEPAVAGYDLMNEPEPGLAPEAEGTAELMPFYAKVVAAMRAAVPGFRQLVFLEPGVERNTTAARAFVLPWSAYSPYRGAVYAPHVYTDVFTPGALTGLPEVATFDSDYQAAVDDADALGLPLWIGEFGGTPATDGTVLAQHYAEQEKWLAGGVLWLWKENANDTIGNTFWGVYGPPFRGATARGVPQPDRIRRTSRVYPMVTAGILLSAVSDPYAGTADVRAISAAVRPGDRSHGTLVVVPAVFAGSRLVVTGARMEVVPRDGGREVWLYPTRGAYRLQVVAR
jgi:endoglycosylceramidase